MNDKFVPLALPGKPAGESANTIFRVKVLPPEGGPPAVFVPSPSASASAASPAVAGSAAVTLERDAQQRIARIRLQCGCGQAHELDCTYE